MNIKITINDSDSAKVFLASFFFFNKNNSYYVNSDIDLSFLKSIDYDLENDLSAYECVKKYNNEDIDLELVVNGTMLCVKNIEDIFEKYKDQSFDKVGSFDKNVFNTDCYLKGNGTEILECKSLNHLEYINHSNTDGIINYTNSKNTSAANLRLGLNYSRLYYYFSKIGCSEEFIKIQETNMLKYFKNSFTIKNGLYEYESNLIRQIGLYSVLNFDEKGTYNDTVQDVNYVIFISTDYFDAGIVTIKSLLLYNNINKLTIFLYGEEKDRNICKTRFERLNIKANIIESNTKDISTYKFEQLDNLTKTEDILVLEYDLLVNDNLNDLFEIVKKSNKSIFAVKDAYCEKNYRINNYQFAFVYLKKGAYNFKENWLAYSGDKNQYFADQKFFNTYTHEIEELPSTYCYTAWHLKDRITPKVIHFETMCKPFADRIDWITNMNVIDNVINDNNNVNSRILINFFYRKYLNFVLSLGKAVFRTFNLTVRVNCNGTRIRDYNKLQENF